MAISSDSVTVVWQECLPGLVDMLGETDLLPTMDKSLKRIVSFDLSCMFAYSFQARPILVHDGLQNVSPPVVMSRYLNGTYLLDAVYNACRQEIQPGLYRLKELAPDNFFRGEYYNSPEFHPCISMETGALSEEIVFITRVDRIYLAYSLLRQKQNPPFTHREFAALQETVDIVLVLLAKQYQIGAIESSGLHNDGERGSRISQALETFAEDRLTSREQEITAMILRGYSNKSIAKSLFITEGTVKNHRKKIYRKININKQSQLFVLFMQYLFKDV
jgi:DNA-binding CsgD family transcriptional regulator